MSTCTLSLLFAGGGTGGHLLPGIAMGNAVRKHYPETCISYLVPGKPVDLAILAATPYPWHINPMRALPRTIEQGMHFPAKFIGGCGITMHMFRRYKPNVVICLGGYGALSAGTIAHFRKIPMVMLEANRIAGKVVRWLAKWSEAVYSNGEVAGIPQRKLKKLGIPLRADLPFEKKIAPIERRKAVVLVMGGSLGAQCINQAIGEAVCLLSDLQNEIRFIHLSGNCKDEIERVYQNAGFEAEVFSFSSEMGDLYQKADLVICRAGGSTLAEIAAVGLPSILIPFAHAAHDHQKANAVAMANENAAVLIEEKVLSGQLLAKTTRELIKRPQKLANMARQAKKLGKPQASLEIVQDILTWLN